MRERERERVNRKFNFDTFSAESDFLSNVEQVNATWWDQPCKRFFDLKYNLGRQLSLHLQIVTREDKSKLVQIHRYRVY